MMRKTTIIYAVLLILALLLTACGPSSLPDEPYEAVE